MFLINLLFIGSMYGLLLLFGVKFVSSIIKGYSDSEKTNRRFVNSLAKASRKRVFKQFETEEISRTVNGDLTTSFSYDGHYFFISTDATGQIVSCTAHHGLRKERVLHFIFDKKQGVYLEKNISHIVIQNEKKDIAKIEAFMERVMHHPWFQETPEETKDYNVVKEVIITPASLSAYVSDAASSDIDRSRIKDIQTELKNSDLPLKEHLMRLIDACIVLSDKVQEFDVETQHLFYSIVNKDISSTYEALQSVAETEDTYILSKIQTSIGNMQSILNEISASIEMNQRNSIENKVRIIEKKYQN